MRRVDYIDKGEVKKFREHLGGGQTEAAEWAGVTVRQWQRYEAGDSGVKKFLAERIRSRLATLRKRR